MSYEERKAELKDIFNQVKGQFESKGYTLDKAIATYEEGEYTYFITINND